MSTMLKWQEYIGKIVMENPDSIKPDVKHPDGEGKEIAFKLVDGMHYPCIPGLADILSGLPNLPIRDDDVLIPAFPKSGTNWIWEVCSMIVRKSPEPLNAMKMEGFIEFLPPQFLNESPSPRVINTHVLPERLPNQLLAKKTKLIMVLRNPKDVAVSFCNHTKSLPLYEYSNGTFNGYFEVFINGKNDYGSWFDYTLSWDKFLQKYPKDRQLILYFEDLKQDLPKYVGIIAKYLKVDIDDDLVNKIADQCGFKKMREAKMRLLQQNVPKAPGDTDNASNQNSKTMADLFRKGLVGDWKNNFTVAQNERLDAMYKAKMGGCSFKFRYE